MLPVDPKKPVFVDPKSALAAIQRNAQKDAKAQPAGTGSGIKRKRDELHSAREVLQQRMLAFSEKHSNWRLPYYIQFEAGRKVALNAIVGVSEATAHFTLELLFNGKDDDEIPDDVPLADVVGADGREYLACDAGKALAQILDMNPPYQISLAAVAQLPAVATHFKADSILNWLPEYFASGFEKLTCQEALWLLERFVEQSGVPGVQKIAASCLPLLGRCFTVDAEHRAAVQRDLTRFLMGVQDGSSHDRWFEKAVTSCARRPWLDPVPEALLCLVLCIAESRGCGPKCAHKKGRARAVKAAVRRSLHVIQRANPKSGVTACAVKLLCDFGSSGDSEYNTTCVLSEALFEALSALNESGQHAPRVEQLLSSYSGAQHVSRNDSSLRWLLLGKPCWPSITPKEVTFPAQADLGFYPQHDSQPWRMVMQCDVQMRPVPGAVGRRGVPNFERHIAFRIGAQNFTDSTTRASVRIAAITQDDDLPWITFIGATWLRSRASGPTASEGFLFASGGTPVPNSPHVFELAPGEAATLSLEACMTSLSTRLKGPRNEQSDEKARKSFNTHKSKNQVVFVALLERSVSSQPAEGAAAHAM